MLEAYATGYSARYSLASMVGRAPAFQSMKEKAGRAARSDQHMLLQGEPGTGKQRLAHGIHQASTRAAGPLITVKCGNAALDMLEAELFGITSPQGEVTPGKFELAKGGTLFLDEIEKLPPVLAQKLADALLAQETGKKTADVRVIAACDGDLRRLAEKGRFPEKLYELIAKPLIRVPSIRMRREDIALLAEHIIMELAEQHAMPGKKLSPEAVSLLTEYDWPGNIKQLQTVIEQAFFRTPGVLIEADTVNLPEEAGGHHGWKDDRDAFLAVWKAARGNVSRLSGMLGVSRVTLYRYLKKYGLEKE
jgi:DNA-binding NtrC family response regulator